MRCLSLFFRFIYLKMKKVICAIALIATAGMTAQQFSKTQALDSVYLDTKILKPRDQSGKIVTLITATELASQQGDNLATIINAVSGIELNGSRSNDGQGYFRYRYFRGILMQLLQMILIYVLFLFLLWSK